MRLNLGCGNNKRAGWLNVDKFAACEPDMVVDLEQFPWPWQDGYAEEIHMSHVLEHLGALPDVYINVMKELWRVSRDSGLITIIVPHPRHDDFLSDPTHVRPITMDGLVLFSREANEFWKQHGCSNSPLAFYHGVDLEIVGAEMSYEEPWASDLRSGRISREAVEEAALRYNNVVKEQKFVLRALKSSHAKI
jgi:hypothetical protein